MKRLLLLLLPVIFIAGCATFEELEPDPEITPAEMGYIELKNDDELFELEAGEKYFVKFPPPVNDNFYIALKLENAQALDYYFTDTFDDGEGQRSPVEDQAQSEQLAVYEADPMQGEDATYYWVIENVMQDVNLQMEYRYVPVWRFRFESRYENYKNILAENSIDRNIYNRIGPGYDLSGINFGSEIDKVSRAYENLRQIKDELDELESIFPANLDRSDEAYQNYSLLKEQLSDELRFQDRYLSSLRVFQKINDSQGNIENFLSGARMYLELLNKDGVKSEVLARARELFGGRQAEAAEYYMNLLRNKRDLTPIELDPPVNVVAELFRKSEGGLNSQMSAITDYIGSYNSELEKLNDAKEQFRELQNYFVQEGSWPSNNFYSGAISRLREIIPMIPRSSAAGMQGFSNLAVSRKLESEIEDFRGRMETYLSGYRRASEIVPQINTMRQNNDYRGIIRLLTDNRGLGFLMEQYPDVDELYIRSMESGIASAITNRNWERAESLLRDLHNMSGFVDTRKAEQVKSQVVNKYEEMMYAEIKEASKQRVDRFVENNINTVTNVEALYQDSVFTPVYRVTFASGGQEELSRKRAEIDNYLDQMKYYYFPENSIEKIYASFIGNINNRGVEKCKAIVVHGKYYRGDNQKIKNIINECNIQIPKWITKAKTYRKLYTYPVTDNRTGNNEYLFKVQLQIPSDAEFPVYDINIKLPEEVAKNAGTEKWYKIMTLDGKEVKIEGRVKMTAPSAENNYEFQVSPVQMDKDGRNVLEVRFVYPDYKVFEISAMAQKPIIKKN